MTINYDAMIGCSYFLLALLELIEIFLPWFTYCGVLFSLFSTFSIDKGLSPLSTSVQFYNQLISYTCNDFKPIIERACIDFCEIVPRFQQAGIAMLSTSVTCMILNIFFGSLYWKKSKGTYIGEINGLASWLSVFLKIFTGILYFEILQPHTIRSTWHPDYDEATSLGIYLFFLDVFLNIVIAYIIYNFKAEDPRIIHLANN